MAECMKYALTVFLIGIAGCNKGTAFRGGAESSSFQVVANAQFEAIQAQDIESLSAIATVFKHRL